MTEPMIAFFLLGALLVFFTGAALLPRRLAVVLAATRPNPAAEAAVIAQALAKVRR